MSVLKNPEPAPPPSARTAACAVACVAALLKNPEPAQPPWESGSCQLSCPTTQPWAHKAGRRAHICESSRKTAAQTAVNV